MSRYRGDVDSAKRDVADRVGCPLERIADHFPASGTRNAGVPGGASADLAPPSSRKAVDLLVDAVGPGGEMRLTINGDADLAEITELLRNTVFGSDE
jgi:hypothetical protein